MPAARHCAVTAATLAAVLGGCDANRARQPAALANAGEGNTATATIEAIQGTGPTSPLEDRSVRFDGVVTGDFQHGDGDDGDLGGFFAQSAGETGAASRGVFVYEGMDWDTDVSPGDRVRVEGRVVEFFGETQVRASSVTVTGRGSIEPVDIRLPASATTKSADGDVVADLESFEGMLVRLPIALTVDSLRNLERYGEIRLSAGGRPLTFTQTSRPDADGFRAHRRSLAARTIRLDDGRRAQNTKPVRYLQDGVIRAGDTVRGLTGNLRYSRGSGESGVEGWRLEPVEPPLFETRNPRSTMPSVRGGLRVATFNVQNYFSKPDDGHATCGPRREHACRGADSLKELERQRAGIVAALVAIDADIAGLVELENDPGDAAIADIVTALNDRSGEQRYGFVATGPVGMDAIRVGLVYRPETVSPLGDFATLDARVDPRYDDSSNRPALAHSFRHADVGTLTVIVAHLKSKGSSCADDGDPDIGDGQGNCNRTREDAAAALADWAVTEPTGHGGGNALVIGDLNAYAREDPLAAFEARDFVNLVRGATGVAAYTYVYDGQAGSLDYALATPALAERVVDAVVWHINSDEARSYDYNLEFGRDAALFDPASPYRSSDHDPVIVGIDASR